MTVVCNDVKWEQMMDLLHLNALNEFLKTRKQTAIEIRPTSLLLLLTLTLTCLTFISRQAILYMQKSRLNVS